MYRLPVLMVGLLMLLWPGVGASSPHPIEVQKVQISAKRFKFRPSRIRMRAGETLEIELKSLDVMHGFHIVGSQIDVGIPARGKGSVAVAFTPSEPGKYRFVCSHQCGAGHAQMRGVIEVRSPDPGQARVARLGVGK